MRYATQEGGLLTIVDPDRIRLSDLAKRLGHDRSHTCERFMAAYAICSKNMQQLPVRRGKQQMNIKKLAFSHFWMFMPVPRVFVEIMYKDMLDTDNLINYFSWLNNEVCLQRLHAAQYIKCIWEEFTEIEQQRGYAEAMDCMPFQARIALNGHNQYQTTEQYVSRAIHITAFDTCSDNELIIASMFTGEGVYLCKRRDTGQLSRLYRTSVLDALYGEPE